MSLSLAQLELLQRLRQTAQKAVETRKHYAEFCREAGLDVREEIPTGIRFFFSYLFQPFQLYKRLLMRTGLPPNVHLGNYFYSATVTLEMGIWTDWDECVKYSRQVQGVSYSFMLASLAAAFIWAKPTLLSTGFVLLSIVIFFIGILLARTGSFRIFIALSIISSLITIAYALAGYSKASLLALFIGLVAIGLLARRRSSQVIAMFATLATGIFTVAMINAKIWAPLLLVGILVGSLWHSGDVLTKDDEPSPWRYILIPFGFMVLFPFLLVALQQLEFTARTGFAEALRSESVRMGGGLVVTGFALGYCRLLESLVIAVYQLVLYVLERVFGVTTIQFSPIKYNDSHFANLFLVPHLTYAYKREPTLAKKVLNYCLISPHSQFVRLWVLKKVRPDAFLSVNSANRTEARQLNDLLTSKGLSIWYYEAQLVLGQSDWERDINTAIQYAKTSLVLIGKEGAGNYQKKEIDACFREHDKRDLPVIPIFLPEAQCDYQRLINFTFIDYRRNGHGDLFGADVIERLKLAITGKRF